jgi:hypothetical protein
MLTVKATSEAFVEKTSLSCTTRRAISANEYQFAASVERFRNACNDEGFAGGLVSTPLLPVSFVR